MNVSVHQATFLDEADELLEQIQRSVLELESRPDDPELLNSLFRAFHTLKGSSAMVGFDNVAGFTHQVEAALERARAGELTITPQFASLLLRAKDHVHDLLAAHTGGAIPKAEVQAELTASFLALRTIAVERAADHDDVANFGVRTTYSILFRPSSEVLRQGVDPADLVESLRALGTCQVTCRTDQVPSLAELDPTSCRLAWDITLTTLANEAAIRDVFIFVDNSSELRIEPAFCEFVSIKPAAPEIEASQLAREPVLASRAQQPTAAQAGRAAATVRVPSERLDRLVSLVGELVINQSRLQQAFVEGSSTDMAAPVEAMERLIFELRDSVLGIRMMPIGATFSRFQRLVRDLSAELDKQVEFVTSGAETELDKTVIDQLGDPLVHMIRNSLDHGIEAPSERLEHGKSAHGTLRLSATHEGPSVVISISDDGRGLNKQAILAKAIEKGLITPDTQLSEQEAFELIMRPGFSTAASVTKVSGRGVGMDVVKRTIEGLRGSLTLSSKHGEGTTIRVTLPLTLAIIDGLLVDVAGERFVVPMSSVAENVELTRGEREANNGRNAVPVRGELVPYIYLRELFVCAGNPDDLERIVIVSVHGERVGLVVDRVLGSHQTVIQPLGRFYRTIELFSGATIMGDGSVAMILDLAGVLRRSNDVTTALLH